MNRTNQCLSSKEAQKLYLALSNLQKSQRQCLLSLEEVLKALGASSCSSDINTIGGLLSSLISDNESGAKNSTTKESLSACARLGLRGAQGATFLASCLALTVPNEAEQSSTKAPPPKKKLCLACV